MQAFLQQDIVYILHDACQLDPIVGSEGMVKWNWGMVDIVTPTRTYPPLFWSNKTRDPREWKLYTVSPELIRANWAISLTISYRRRVNERLTITDSPSMGGHLVVERSEVIGGKLGGNFGQRRIVCSHRSLVGSAVCADGCMVSYIGRLLTFNL